MSSPRIQDAKNTNASIQMNLRYGAIEGYQGATVVAGILEVSVANTAPSLYEKIREDFAEEGWMFEGIPVAVNKVYPKDLGRRDGNTLQGPPP